MLNDKKATVSFNIGLVLEIIYALAWIAVIVLILWMVYSAFAPSVDKSSEKSFENVFSIIDTKSRSVKPYDSTRTIITLADTDYQVFIFKGDKINCDPNAITTVSATGGTGGSSTYISKKVIERPSNCDPSGICMCLYVDQPTSKDEDVASCKTFSKDFEIESFELNNGKCERIGGKALSLIISMQYDGTKRILNVWEDNDKNRKKDEQFSKQRCPISNTVCSGKLDGELLTGINYYDKVYQECKTQSLSKLAIQATCVYDANANPPVCNLDCTQNSLDCSKIQSCDDYYLVYGKGTLNPYSFRYMEKDSPSYYYCSNDAMLCDVSKGQKCKVEDFNHLSCINSNTGEINPDPDCAFPSCNTKYFGQKILSKYVQSYDSTVCSSQDINDINTNFIQSDNIYVCAYEYGTADYNQYCENIIKLPAYSSCEFKIINSDQKNIITYYDKGIAMCNAIINNYFAPAYQCSGPALEFNPINVRIDPTIIVSTNPNEKLSSSIPCKIALGQEIKCLKGTRITLFSEITNNGDFAIKLIAKPNALKDSNSFELKSTEQSLNPQEKREFRLSLTLDNNANVEYDLYPGSYCTDDYCKNLKTDVKYKALNDANHLLRIITE
ncbi:TPA: hypothetical protein HA235_05170 [Candidatus Woesearchaeota archaeon]|nr:hypothetical protein [Candidatus Woesearchaeota archaeon]HIH32072.1 hypothetical protein [Candidatus Woesearchaeota archaeon]HIH55118.1 hypothetical protein [Candidatus Woesearchaeota archaeon]HIJ01673.1 hypothetical protein [Candidatus Woesearchaeota archaeon]HIJ13333.1 hypothetical protein [Candidatus Woesearchaeota archaeon]